MVWLGTNVCGQAHGAASALGIQPAWGPKGCSPAELALLKLAAAQRTDVRCSSSMRRITCNVLSIVCCVSSCRAMVTRSPRGTSARLHVSSPQLIVHRSHKPAAVDVEGKLQRMLYQFEFCGSHGAPEAGTERLVQEGQTLCKIESGTVT